MGFLVSQKGKINLVVQGISIIAFLVLAFIGLINLIGWLNLGSPPFLDVFLVISTSLGVMVVFLKGDLALIRLEYRINRYCSENKINKALEVINKKIISDHFGRKSAWLAIKAMVLIKKGNLKKADKILEKIEEKSPDFFYMLYYKGCLESIKGNTKISLKYLRKQGNIHKKSIEETRDPIKRWVGKKNMKNFITVIKKDKDLQNVRQTEGFDRLVKSVERFLAD